MFFQSPALPVPSMVVVTERFIRITAVSLWLHLLWAGIAGPFYEMIESVVALNMGICVIHDGFIRASVLKPAISPWSGCTVGRREKGFQSLQVGLGFYRHQKVVK